MKKKETRFATKINDVTESLFSMLEEMEVDERCLEESEFHRSRRTKEEENELLVDFWSSTAFHVQTARVEARQVPENDAKKKGFYPKGTVVFFRDPKKGKKTFTGIVRSSPHDSAVRRMNLDRQELGLHKIEVLAKERVLGLMEETNQRKWTEIIEHLGKRRKKLRFILLRASELQNPREARDQKLKTTTEKWILRFVRAAFESLRSKMLFERRREEFEAASAKIQSAWRAYLAKQTTLVKKIAYEMALEQSRLEAERRRAIAEEKHQNEEYERFLREKGITRDGVRFFATEEGMEKFYARQKRLMERVFTALTQLASNLKFEALKSWKYYIEHVLPPKQIDLKGLDADVKGFKELLLKELQYESENPLKELGDLHWKMAKVAQIQVARRNLTRPSEMFADPWHPGFGLKLPALPVPNVVLQRDGKLQIENLQRFKNFKDLQRGPTDSSSFLIHGAHVQVIFGAYPQGQADKRMKRITAKNSAIRSVLEAGVDTFVSLMFPEEMAKMENANPPIISYDEEADSLLEETRTQLQVSLKPKFAAVEKAKARVKRARQEKYGREQLEALEEAHRLRRKELEKSQQQFSNIPEKLVHLNFPLPRYRSTQDGDERVLSVCKNLELRLRNGERLFIFSQSGSGRVGIIAALLLGRLYNLTPHDALHRVQRLHDIQLRFENMTPAQIPTCPTSITQTQQVVRLLTPIQNIRRKH